MASNREQEVNAVPDERAPLLAHDEAHYDPESTPDHEEPLAESPQKARSRIWKYAWRGFWAIFAILIIALFVKGWIDADDVNVSLCMMGSSCSCRNQD